MKQLLSFPECLSNHLTYWFSHGGDFASWGYLGMSGDILGCRHWEKPGMLPNSLQFTQYPPRKKE